MKINLLDVETNADVLANNLQRFNELYRNGTPEISDIEYDSLVARLADIAPDHPFLNKVEEEVIDKQKVKHTTPMLSIEKAFSVEELERFFNRVEKINPDVFYRVTPKLDGMAAKHENLILATRGDGLVGYNITDAFEKGLAYDCKTELDSDGNFKPTHADGVGEIVLSKSYFEENLTEHFDHPRNCVVGAIKCDTLNTIQKKTMNDGAIKFVKYDNLPCVIETSQNILDELDKIVESLSNIDYPIDGYVIEVHKNFPDVIQELGSTSHHNKWQIAYKVQGEKKQTVVNDITLQTGRGGNITPVLEVEPVVVSGATISRVTGHNYGYLKKKKIGIGTKIEIIRSGEVIPKVVGVISDERDVPYIERCPVCLEPTILVNDIIKCPNFQCLAQLAGRLEHFFKTLKIDLFGQKTIDKMISYHFDSIEDIFDMTEEDFLNLGFGEKQSENFVSSIQYALFEQYEDWKILASVSIPMLGRGDSKKLLKHYYIEELFDLTIDDIVKIEGFGDKKANSIIYGLAINKDLIEFLLESFDVVNSKDEESKKSDKLEGQGFVFTGKMSMSRDEMMKLCDANGGVAQKSLTKKTDYLIMGENVGKSKTGKAEKYGTIMLTEKDFMEMIG